MRLTLALVACCLTASSLAAQTVIKFTFDAQPGVSTTDPAEAGNVIARRQQLRVWQDSLEVFAQQAVAELGGTAWRVTTDPAARANYRVSVVAVSISKPGVSAFAMAAVVFEPATLVPWRYLTHFVAFSESAREAAYSLVRMSISSIQGARR
jgi:hypothetical protein